MVMTLFQRVAQYFYSLCRGRLWSATSTNDRSPCQWGSYSCKEYSVVNINYTCTVAIRHLQVLHYPFSLFFLCCWVVAAPYMIRTVPLSTGARYPPLRIILMFTYLHLALWSLANTSTHFHPSSPISACF